MLVVDAFLTLVTWIPISLYASVVEIIQLDDYSFEQLQRLIKVYQFLKVLMLTNAFTTPIVYFIFNKNFRVSLVPSYSYVVLLVHHNMLPSVLLIR